MKAAFYILIGLIIGLILLPKFLAWKNKKKEDVIDEVKNLTSGVFGDVEDCFKKVSQPGGIAGGVMYTCYSKANWKIKLETDYTNQLNKIEEKFGVEKERPIDGDSLQGIYDSWMLELTNLEAQINELNDSVVIKINKSKKQKK